MHTYQAKEVHQPQLTTKVTDVSTDLFTNYTKNINFYLIRWQYA